MRQRLWSLSGVVFATVIICGSSAGAQTVAVGPYYATPSWDQTFVCTTAGNCPRFVVLANFSNQAVLDRETGLVWQQSPSVPLGSLPDAVFDCLNSEVGGRGGWRLPTVYEMFSLFDHGVLPAGHPFSNVQTGAPGIVPLYWTATSAQSGFFFQAGFDANGGSQVGIFPTGNNALGWCVRGGVGVNSSPF